MFNDLGWTIGDIQFAIGLRLQELYLLKEPSLLI